MSQQQAKIIARQSRQNATLGQVLFKQSCETQDDFVPGFAADTVIDELQVVEIEVDNLVGVAARRQRFERLMQLRLKSSTIHKPGHAVERLLDDIFNLAYDMRHEALVTLGKRILVDTTELRERTLDIALLIEYRTQHCLKTLFSVFAGPFNRWNFKDNWLALAFKLRQQFLDYVTIHHLAINFLPA